MKKIFYTINKICVLECQKFNIQYNLALAMIFTPIIVILLFGLTIALPETRNIALYMVEENHPVEILTFIFLILGSLHGLYLAWWIRLKIKDLVIWSFYAVFSIGLFLTAMEEIAWGQTFFNFQTPAFWKTVNMQGELTIHNLKGLQGHSEYFRILFGIGGLIGIWLNSSSRLYKIGVPKILLTCFLTITAVSGLDLFNDYIPIEKHFDYGLQRMSEVIEMLIGIGGFFYVWLMIRRLKINFKS